MPDSLTEETLLVLVENERCYFLDDFFALHSDRINSIKNSSELVRTKRDSIHRNTVKRRAHIFLTDVWELQPEMFVLCSLAATPSRLGTLKSKNYIAKLTRWWREVEQPRLLTKIVEKLSNILPPPSGSIGPCAIAQVSKPLAQASGTVSQGSPGEINIDVTSSLPFQSGCMKTGR